MFQLEDEYLCTDIELNQGRIQLSYKQPTVDTCIHLMIDQRWICSARAGPRDTGQHTKKNCSTSGPEETRRRIVRVSQGKTQISWTANSGRRTLISEDIVTVLEERLKRKLTTEHHAETEIIKIRKFTQNTQQEVGDCQKKESLINERRLRWCISGSSSSITIKPLD